MTDRIETVGNALYVRRRHAAVLAYAVTTALSYGMAYLLRFEFSPPADYLQLFFLSAPPLVLVRLIAFRFAGLMRERWRYTSAHTVARLAAATLYGSVLLLIADLLLPLEPRVPLSIIIMEGILTIWFTAAAWLAYRLSFEHFKRRSQKSCDRKRALIIGAGEAGNLLAREMVRSPVGYIPVGFVDDNSFMWGMSIQGIEVVGSTLDLPDIVKHLDVDEIIIAVPSAEPAELRRIVRQCDAADVPFKVLPGIRAVFGGEVSLNQLRGVQIEDLLGREPVELELPELQADLSGRSVLITGAAGSIGSELSRQVALHRPARLVLLDQAETPLFYLELELRARHPEMEIVPVVGDIVDEAGMTHVFAQYTPQRVFHAAAYKHVPLMELNAREAIRNNVIGTWRVAELAGRCGIEKFVLVSTDKAVQPTSIMGATKRLAELVVLDLQQRYPETSFGAVRFGNVLGSNGSVIPVFKRQLAEGKPLTVTHPEVTRYFMTIPEAVQLILQTSLLNDLRGRIAMLEMGEPVRILDLAMNLLRLAGIPDGAERISFIGLRPGEKLHEELNSPDEEAVETPIPKVRLLRTPTIPRVAASMAAWDASFATNGADMLQGFISMFPHLTLEQRDLGDRRSSSTAFAI